MAGSGTRHRSPLRRLMRVLGAIVLVFVLAVGIGAVYSWRLASRAPEWWHPVNAGDPQVDHAARSLENGVSDQIHRVRPIPTDGSPAATWTLSIPESDANAWLAARLRDWLSNRSEKVNWPANASEPQVSFRDGEVVLGFEVSEGGKGRVISVALSPTIDANGSLWLKLMTFSIGRFSVPGGDMAQAGGSLLESRLPPEMKSNPDTRRFIGALSGSSPLTDHAVIKLADGRKVEMVRMTLREGVMEVECRTMPR